MPNPNELSEELHVEHTDDLTSEPQEPSVFASYPDGIGISELAKITEITRNWWNSVLASEMLRLALGFDDRSKKFPPSAYPFLAWFAEQKRVGNKYAAPSSVLSMYDQWKRQAQIVTLPPVGDASSDAAPPAGSLTVGQSNSLAVKRPNSEAGIALPVGGSVGSIVGAADSQALTVAINRVAAALEAAPPPEDELLTCEEVSLKLKMSEGWVRKNVPPVALGRSKRWRQSDVLRFIAGLGA